MGITRKTTDKEIQTELAKQQDAIGKGIINILNYVGLQFVTDARKSLDIDTGAFPGVHKMTKKEIENGKSQPQTGDYLDQTANLRSSIGYFIFKDGIQIKGSVQGTFEGTAAAMTLLNSIPKSGFQLIGVAGMDYASYVESQGFNVITSQSNVAIVSLDKRLKAYAAKKGLSDINADIQGVTSVLR